MKVSKVSLFFRLGTMASVLLFGQQAFAIGTASGTLVDNTVTVDYDVNGIEQDDLTDSVSFAVDRRVDFTIGFVGGGLIDVTPGEQDAFFDLLLTNDSNSALDFSISLDQAGVTSVRGQADTENMDNIEYSVSAVYDGTTPPAGTGGAQYVDELPADAAVVIRVYGDAALSLANGDIAGIELTAVAGESGNVGVEGGALTYSLANDADPLVVDNVAADNGNDGSESLTDGFNVVSAALTVTKAFAVIDDGNGLGTDLPLPGATVEYTITVTNGSLTDAEDVVIQDVIDTADLGANPIVLNVPGAIYNGSDVAIYNDGVQLACDIETVGGVCDYTDPNLDIGVGGGTDVAGNTTLTIQYQVVIPDPDPTP